ncbi:RAD55 family ATPase [Halorarius litoreus]|uniref:RAD55 family ATPase n=1 Tax=Halorarius litoreus TaxID=2962676 RepID=UPI0020CC2916|nr:transcriptional regulator [Halorarius litoreus]
MTERLSTGVDVVNRRLGGGVPAGTLLAISSPPDAGSEQLLHAFLSTHGGRYLSLLRPAAEVDGELPPFVDVRHVRPEGFLDEPERQFDGLPEQSVVAIDPVNELESASTEAYVALLSALKRRLAETGSVGVLHCLRTSTEPENRWLTLGRADWAWHVELTRLPLSVETRLYVTKARNGRALLEPLKIQFLDGVRVDTSRDI